MTDFRALPKVELHLHLEGAAPPALVRRLAEAKGVRAEGLFDGVGGYDWQGFSGFLAAYDHVSALFDTLDDHRALVEAVLGECAAHGVVYAELAVSPDLAAGADPALWRDYLAAVSEGAEAARAAHGIEARFVATCIRNLGPDAALGAARLAADAGGAVVGLGLAGDERVLSPADFTPAFDLAREAGLKLTVHAGEFGGADSVRGALDALRPDRIDHGVRAVEDPALVARLAEEGVPLAVCPGSNVALGVVPDWPSHPIDRLRRAGVPVNVSTDDPPFFGTDMTREYAMLAETFGWTEDDLRAVGRAGLDAAFCDDGTRARLAARLG